MTTTQTNPLLAGLHPQPPGAPLREVVLPATGLPKAEIARRLKVSRNHLYEILAEKQPVTAAMALRLGRLFGQGATLWINMQGQYDLRTAEAEMAAELEAMEPLAAA